MNYLKKYKLFESLFDMSTIDISEDLDDICLCLHEDYGINITLTISEYSKSKLSEMFGISNRCALHMTNINLYKSSHRDSDNRIDESIYRLCRYLSSRYNTNIDFFQYGGNIIIGDSGLISFINFVNECEFPSENTDSVNVDGYLESDDSLPGQKYSLISGLNFRCIPNINIFNSMTGFSIYVKYEYKVLIFEFTRTRNVDIYFENVEYDINIFLVNESDREFNKQLRLRTLISSARFRMKNKLVETTKLSCDISKVDIYFEKLRDLLTEKTCQYFQLERNQLLIKSMDILSNQNEFFNTEEIYLDKDRNIKFEINDIEYKLIVTKDLKLYIGSIKPENETSLDELIHDIFLNLN